MSIVHLRLRNTIILKSTTTTSCYYQQI